MIYGCVIRRSSFSIVKSAHLSVRSVHLKFDDNVDENFEDYCDDIEDICQDVFRDNVFDDDEDICDDSVDDIVDSKDNATRSESESALNEMN